MAQDTERRWRLVTPREIRAFREREGVSVVRLSESWGVSYNTIIAWEKGDGLPPSLVTQTGIRALIDAGAPPPKGTPPPPAIEPPVDDRGELEATERILAAYFVARKVDQAEIAGLVRQVRAALRPAKQGT